MQETILHGFRMDKATESEELGGILREMTHIQTGAQLVWLDNGQDNLVFSIAFQTLPWDDSGVFHILEHSVLCGSEHFPVKEPFLELLKGSMQTYLNALTFPDKTVYPVSSRNRQDFLNLVQVYLDAVFFPAIHRQKNIFLQEGWHYAMTQADENPAYQGVVYSEMLGAGGTVDAIGDNALCRLLYPDSCYRFISGGDPDAIPTLKYESFLQAHRDFYHPSNARIYLDGKVPLELLLEMLDRDYLSKFSRRAPAQVSMQAPVPAREAVEYYPIGQEEPIENKVHLLLGSQLCHWSDRKTLLAFDILGAYLTGSNAAPLKQALLESGLAQDVYLYANDGMAQPYWAMCIRGTEQHHCQQLKELLQNTVETLLARGLDPQELEANIDQMEFMLLEAEEPRGIQRAITVLSTWLYGGSPLDALQYRALLQQLRGDIGTGYFETLLRQLFLDNRHTATVCLLPSKTIAGERAARERQQLEEARQQWSAQQLQAILRENQALLQWQQTPDSPEALAMLPRLTLADISPMPEQVHTLQRCQAGATVLFHPIDTRGVVHLRLYFSVSDLPLAAFSDLSLLCELYGELPTSHRSPSQLQQQIKRCIGHLHIAPVCYAMPGQPELCKPFLVVSVSALESKLAPALELVADMLKNTRFDDAGKIRQILLQTTQDLSETLLERGDQFAALRALKNHSAALAVREHTDGFTLLQHLRQLQQSFTESFPSFADLARHISASVFTPERLTMSLTGAAELPAADILLPLLGHGKAVPEQLQLPLSDENLREAIVVPAGISCTACGENLRHFDTQFDGRLSVLCGLVSYSYLWNAVRVTGGAYGCGFGAGESGNLSFTSFQDPSPLNTLAVYAETGSFIRDFCRQDEALEKYIISTIASGEPLQSPAKRGAAADGSYFCGISYEDRCRRRRELLQLQKASLQELASLFDRLGQRRSLCIVCDEETAQQLPADWIRLQP